MLVVIVPNNESSSEYASYKRVVSLQDVSILSWSTLSYTSMNSSWPSSNYETTSRQSMSLCSLNQTSKQTYCYEEIIFCMKHVI
jgi:hypothetical protein